MDLTSKLGLGLITDFLDKEKVFNKNTGLNRTDAEKVLIIHTNPGGFGRFFSNQYRKCLNNNIRFLHRFFEEIWPR